MTLKSPGNFVNFFFLLLNKLTCPLLVWLPVRKILHALKSKCNFVQQLLLTGNHVSSGQVNLFNKNKDIQKPFPVILESYIFLSTEV